MKRDSYRQLSNFGNPIDQRSNDPLTYCLQDTMDKSFQHGGTARLYGPRSQKCQVYMAQRCAENWDGFCEYFYQTHGVNGEWPNNRLWPNTATSNNGLSSEFLTTGDQLLSNTAEQKYCKYSSNCPKTCEPFDPLNPDSPMITFYNKCDNSSQSCFSECNVDPKTIDSDPVMNKLLQRPQVAGNVLINICNTASRTGTDLSGTKIGAVCNNYFNNVNQMKQQNIRFSQKP